MHCFFSSFWLPVIFFNKEPFHYVRFGKDSRYYELRLQQDLLADWILIFSNGQIKSKLGQSRTLVCSTFNEALVFFFTAVKTRMQRFYQLKQIVIEDLLYTSLLLNFYQIHTLKNRRLLLRKLQ